MKIRSALLLAALLWSGSGPAQQPVRLTPQFVPQQTFRYHFDYRIEREGTTIGLLENPQAPRKVETSVGAILRFDVLRVEQDAKRGTLARLRGTYEKLTSKTRSDLPDPGMAEDEAQRRALEGHSVEFTVDGEGNVSHVTGLEKLFPEQSSVVGEWLGQFALGPAPREPVVPGKSCSVERPLSFAPLAGLVWQGKSTYLRNEPCRLGQLTAGEPPKPSAIDEECAVILTRFEVARRGGAKDATPDEFRRRGLRTAGKYTGSGESLVYVSLKSGWLVSLTQSVTEEMDVTVRAPEQGSDVRNTGRAQSLSRITLVPASAPVAP